MYIYSVENYVGARVQRSDTKSPAQAFERVRETPDASVSKYDTDGWLIDEAIFSPKHPVWSEAKFLKWARSRGKQASKLVRTRR